jgi:hypothetical protein
MPRQCLFCENKADSNEHLWPRWILRRLKIDRPMRHSIGGRPSKIVPRAEIKIKCVCQPCNRGWMHDLENLNIPIIGCLMEDIGIPLSSEQQTTVAKWAVKTAMVQDAIYTRKRELFYTGSERLAVRSNTGLPDYTSVWLGRSSLRTLTCDGTDIRVDINDGSKILETALGSVNTFCVGHLAVQVATIHAPEKYKGHPFDVTSHIAAPWENLLVPIWPVTDSAISWPPSLTLAGRGLTKLADRFRGGVRREW